MDGLTDNRSKEGGWNGRSAYREVTSRAHWDVYWDYVARHYSGVPDLQGDEIIDYFRSEAIVRSGDCILDIGSGFGTYALPLAGMVKQVTAVDLSRKMIEALKANASSTGIDNLEAVQGRWEEFGRERRFDLVLSAFCPAVNGPGALLEMERCSRRTCCYVAGGREQFRLLEELWEIVFGYEYPAHAHEIPHQYNFLRSIGRKPVLRWFARESGGRTKAADVVREFVAYFSCLTDVGPDLERRMKKHVLAPSRRMGCTAMTGPAGSACSGGTFLT